MGEPTPWAAMLPDLGGRPPFWSRACPAIYVDVGGLDTKVLALIDTGSEVILMRTDVVDKGNSTITGLFRGWGGALIKQAGCSIKSHDWCWGSKETS